MVEHAGLTAEAAYSTFNMGSGFAVYWALGAGLAVVELSSGVGLSARVAGSVTDGPRRVVLTVLDVTYQSDDLDLAPRG